MTSWIIQAVELCSVTPEDRRDFFCFLLIELTPNFYKVFEDWSDNEPAVFLWELSHWLVSGSVNVHSYLSELG